MDSIATAASGPFVLLVGPHRQKFIMQSEVVANQCSALKMLVNGPMREGISQEADWKSVSVPTFMCFRSFAYTRDYELPKPCSETTTKPVPVESSPKADEFRLNAGTSSSLWSDLPEGLPKRNAEQESVPANIQADVPADNDFWAPVSKKDRKKKKKSKNKQDEAWTQFIARQKTYIGEIPNQRRVTEPEWTQEGHLLMHAKFYVFADYYGIGPLMILSYNKLHQSLVSLDTETSSLLDVVDVLQYSYDNPTPDCLKQLLAHFAACRVEDLLAEKRFSALLVSDGQLSHDIIRMLVSRLN